MLKVLPPFLHAVHWEMNPEQHDLHAYLADHDVKKFASSAVQKEVDQATHAISQQCVDYELCMAVCWPRGERPVFRQPPFPSHSTTPHPEREVPIDGTKVPVLRRGSTHTAPTRVASQSQLNVVPSWKKTGKDKKEDGTRKKKKKNLLDEHTHSLSHTPGMQGNYKLTAR